METQVDGDERKPVGKRGLVARLLVSLAGLALLLVLSQLSV